MFKAASRASWKSCAEGRGRLAVTAGPTNSMSLNTQPQPCCRRARGAPRQRPGARRLHGRLRHPARSPRDPPGVRRGASARRLARRPGAVRRRGGHPARRPAALLGRRAAAPLRPGLGPRRAGPRALRPVPLGGHHRPVPRRLGAGTRLGRRGRRDAGAALQVGDVLHRAAAAHRRGAGGGRRGDARGAQRLRPAARRGVPAARRPAGGLRRSRGDREAGRATTWSRASARCWSRWPWTALGPEDAAYLDRSLGTPLDGPDVARLRQVIDSSGAHAQVEEAIEALATRALAALDAAPVDPDARAVLRSLATAVTQRVV